MARKTILNDLIGQGVDAAMPENRSRAKTRALGAVSRSIADLKTRAIIEVDPSLIEAGGVRDRLDRDEDAHQALLESLREHGQQVPVLVRPHPQKEGQYQIVYGRRRLLALKELGQPVKVMVRDLDDQALVIAQGQENTARLDLSFIEKVNFAQQMRSAGYNATAICAALSVDKTVVSRMLKVADHIPVEVIEAIGSARGIGRPRWIVLAEKLEEQPARMADVMQVLKEAQAQPSEERFNLALAALSTSKGSPSAEGDPLDAVTVTRSSGRIKLVLPDDAFSQWLVDALPELRKTHAQKTS